MYAYLFPSRRTGRGGLSSWRDIDLADSHLVLIDMDIVLIGTVSVCNGKGCIAIGVDMDQDRTVLPAAQYGDVRDACILHLGGSFLCQHGIIGKKLAGGKVHVFGDQQHGRNEQDRQGKACGLLP